MWFILPTNSGPGDSPSNGIPARHNGSSNKVPNPDKQTDPVWLFPVAILATFITLALTLTLPHLIKQNSPAFEEAIARVGGDPEKGVALMKRYGCAACHIIPGMPGGGTLVGPALKGFASRPTIGQHVPNTPENLIRWIVYPVALDETATMPSVGATEADARDMATYLYALK